MMGWRQMEDMIQIGRVAVNAHIFAAIVAYGVSFAIISMIVRKLHITNEATLKDVYVNAGLWFFFTWKFGAVITEPSLIWKDPMKLIVISGSVTEVIFGLVAACAYIAITLFRQRIALKLFLDIWAVGITTFTLTYVLLIRSYGKPTDLPWGISFEGVQTDYHPVHAYMLILLIPVCIRLLLILRHMGTGILWREFLILYGLAGLLVSLFSYSDVAVILLSWTQWLFVSMIISGTMNRVGTTDDRAEQLESHK
jgi:hypothetical protein